MQALRVGIAGAGIYGSSIAIKLAENGHLVTLYDPLGVMRAASAINQFRVHGGYHYPRSPATIAEILEAKEEFVSEYGAAIVQGTENYYAIPKEDSKTSPRAYERVMDSFKLSLKCARPDWIDFTFIEKCYAVNECLYDPDVLRSLIMKKLKSLDVRFIQARFCADFADAFDFVVYATYGTSGSHTYLFDNAQLQIAEKILIKLPAKLHRMSLVVVDGPFTAFDSYRSTEYSLFGSAAHTNHWSTFDLTEQIPERYASILNAPEFSPVGFTHFERMVHDASRAVPLASQADYIGSRFTLRLIEHNPSEDRRILRIGQADHKTFHVFSGKVTGAIKAAKQIDRKISNF